MIAAASSETNNATALAMSSGCALYLGDGGAHAAGVRDIDDGRMRPYTPGGQFGDDITNGGALVHGGDGRPTRRQMAAQNLADAAAGAGDHRDRAGEVGHASAVDRRQRRGDPVEACRPQVAIVVEGDVLDAGVLEGSYGRHHLAAVGQVGPPRP